MITYNKLIRDRIPEIIAADDKEFSIRTLSQEEFEIELRKKLQEEVNEFMETDTLEEIADIFEVLEYILRGKGATIEDVIQIKDEKREIRGGFEQKLFLETVNDR